MFSQDFGPLVFNLTFMYFLSSLNYTVRAFWSSKIKPLSPFEQVGPEQLSLYYIYRDMQIVRHW